ncbi:trihelix transcription factor GT-3b-like [Gastrolobium bilobum]|uniref:trihelix transcription factor GT-3b-like n=1 Tax=Gastrolobium bilobum TaxID=150636 RepID=UPI002AB24668|nr:trihelix transcription factor GT-3b-like [Gastrolobium bilobum]
MEGHHHLHQQQHHHQRQQQHHHQQQQQQQHPHNITSVNVDVTDKFPQWSIQETKEFLMIRAELDQTFMETKRNKQLWEVISNRMKEKGYHRSSEQCKCKWKNLATRYKGCETMEQEAYKQQFPFYNELQAIFTARMQRMLWAEAEGGSKKKGTMQLSSEDEEDCNINEDSQGDIQKGNNGRKKRKGKMVIGGGSGNSGSNMNNLKEILEDFMRQQMQMEAQWMEAFEARENERRLKEMEWRQTMEALENERIMMDQRWRESEEQRRVREEARADKRDALITALLNKLTREQEM